MILRKIFLLFCLTATTSVISAQDDVDIYDTYYYEFSQVLFGESVDENGYLEGESTSFEAGKAGATEIVVLITNDGALGVKTLNIYLYDEGMNPIDKFFVNISPEWKWTSFSLSLKETGKYFVDVYNEVETFVNTGEFSIYK